MSARHADAQDDGLVLASSPEEKDGVRTLALAMAPQWDNTSLDVLIEQCQTAQRKYASVRRKARDERMQSLAAIYELYLFADGHGEGGPCAEKLAEIGVKVPSGGDALIALVRWVLGCARDRGSVWAAVIRSAARNNIMPPNLERHVKDHGGLEKTATAYFAAAQPKGSPTKRSQKVDNTGTTSRPVFRPKISSRFAKEFAKLQSRNKKMRVRISGILLATGTARLTSIRRRSKNPRKQAHRASGTRRLHHKARTAKAE